MPDKSGEMSWDGTSVLVTGGTGTLGRAIVSALLERTAARRVIVFSRDEHKQWAMEEELAVAGHGARTRFFIGDVRDGKRMRLAFAGVDVVIHAAAMKHVAAAEFNPFEAVQTNILGSQNIIEAAIEAGVKRVLAVSTDKASNPVSLYGATKLVGDRMFLHGNAYLGGQDGAFAVIRFGNLSGSRGSIVPKFREMAALGRVLPVTDPEATRYWVSVRDAATQVLAAVTDMQGGELFVPKAPSVTVGDLVGAIAPGAETRVVGLRPGEKKHEELIGEHDAPYTIDQGDRYVITTAVKYDGMVGRLVEPGFVYTSENNLLWLSTEELTAMVGPEA
ncbi:MAG: SDR family NAD(P)-dependent oxidoreductase [Planctomycetota bacterium]